MDIRSFTAFCASSGRHSFAWRGGKTVKELRMVDADGHRGCVMWLTGLPGAGKTTICRQTERELGRLGIRSVTLDGDQLRQGLCRDLGYSEQDRQENLRRAAEVAAMFAAAGFVVLVAMISPMRQARDQIRQRLQDDGFAEIYVDCPLALCEQRDPKGLYRKARSGEVRDFTGIDAVYEQPLNADLTLKTGHQSIEVSTEEFVAFVIRHLT
ncbi:adenylyl-sulfate kinase [Paenibacillus phyllosphaerae]|uniref:adenylyl-sulfate kinase n=1 Tax=Paenibacillus phyllosphaerae TaxID=274593 RepID=UPI002483A7C0|nr:adenylyl-sulfate kinase [Paenibacillus phyllosphaerae]